MTHRCYPLFVLACLTACGGSPPPRSEPAPSPTPTPTPDPDRPFSHLGEAVHAARRDVQNALGLGNDQPPSQLIPKTRGHQAGDPVAVVVHGIMPVHAHLDAVIGHLSHRAQVYYFQYDDMQDLDETARQLGEALGAVLDQYPSQSVTVVAHSMGGLVSRRALTVGHPSGLAARQVPIRLVTIASPFGGFTGADYARMDMGMGADSWQDVGATSRFINQPGDLGPQVTHVKLETNERGKTRRDGGERVGDDAASIDQQRQADVDTQALRTEMLDLGHVGVLITEARTLPEPTRAALDRAIR